MKTVLFIAYYFPPLAGSGVQKSLKFVKYLQKFKIRPIVLTVNPLFVKWVKDKSLLDDIPPGTTVFRTPTIDMNWLFKIFWGLKMPGIVTWLQRKLLIPDAEITWVPFAKRQLRKIIPRQKIDIVYITGGPFSAMLLGPYINQRYNLKYVLDFRDEWTCNPTRLELGYPAATLSKEQNMERMVLEHCSGVIYTIPEIMRVNFQRKYPFLSRKPFIEITNGYDEEDFQEFQINENKKRSRCKILYTGVFYDRRNPRIIWKALIELFRENHIKTDLIQIELIGKNKPQFVLSEYYDSTVIKNLVSFTPNKNHSILLKDIAAADALLLYIAPGPNSDAEMTGKIFEYMRSYKPILALIPPGGIAAKVLKKAGTAMIYDSSSLEEVKRGIEKLYNDWVSGNLKNEPDVNFIANFERKKLTADLAEFLTKVVETEHIVKDANPHTE